MRITRIALDQFVLLLNTLFTSNTMRCLIGDTDNLCERRPIYVFTEEKIVNV
jgi:hypothetical protein